MDEGYDSLFTSEDLKRKSSANHIYLYRALETEVHRILHLQDDLLDKRGTTIEVWIEDVNHRLKSWYEASQVYTQYGMLEFKHVQYNHLRARIHRPTPRLWIRTKEDREIVLDSTLLLIDDYVGQEDRRRLFYPWHGVHILFETTVIALEACWTSRSCLDLRPKAEEMLETHIPRCLQLLAKMGQRWDEAGACAQRLSPLLENILEVFKSWESSTESSESAAITDEIQGLLYSDGSLTWNYRSTGSRAHVEEPNIFEDMVFEDLQFLQWAPEWDIMPMEMA